METVLHLRPSSRGLYSAGMVSGRDTEACRHENKESKQLLAKVDSHPTSVGWKGASGIDLEHCFLAGVGYR